MAELLGVVSAGFGIAAFALQVGSKVEKLRSLKDFTPAEVGAQLGELSDRLESFRSELVAFGPLDRHPDVQRAIQQASKRFRTVENLLETLQRRFAPGVDGDRGSRRLRMKLALSRQHVEEQIKRASDRIIWISQDLQLACHRACFVILCRQQTPESTAAVVAHVEADVEATKEVAPPTPDGEVGGASVVEAEETADQMISTHLVRYQAAGHRCGRRHCGSLCHLTGNQSGRFWSLEYTPLSILLSRPDNENCESRRLYLSLRRAVSIYGISFALVAGLNITSGPTGVTFGPLLRLERTVKYTSPGFETLFRLEHGDITVDEAHRRFTELSRSDRDFKRHRDPSGKGYLQRLLKYPWRSSYDQFTLFDLFTGEFGMSLADQDKGLSLPTFVVDAFRVSFQSSKPRPFLTTCAKWIGEGPHLDLLSDVLRCGFDPTAVDSPLWKDWPKPCSPDWICEKVTPDPFFVRYLSMLVKDDPGFSGSTPLCNAVLSGSRASVTTWLSRTPSLEDSTTFLGQTPLHLSVTDPSLCELIVDAGHGLDVTDKWGITPLMYAAAMGKTKVVKILLSAGTNPLLRGGLKGLHSHRTFIHYALARGHKQLILDSIDTIAELYGQEALWDCSKHAMMALISPGNRDHPQTGFFSALVERLSDVNFRFDDMNYNVTDRDLMHYVGDISEAQVLVRFGYNSFNRQDSHGKLPINSLCERAQDKAQLVTFCVQNGTDLNNRDNDGCTVLVSLMARWHWDKWDVSDAIGICLDAGIDISLSDRCRCPCAPDGCTVSSVFPTTSHSWIDRWCDLNSLEWITLVEEHQGADAAREVLLTLLRRAKCDDDHIAVNHVCCHRGDGIATVRWPHQPKAILAAEDIDEMLEEEAEFIAALDEELDQLTLLSLEGLHAKWLAVIKERYDAHVVDVEKRREKHFERCDRPKDESDKTGRRDRIKVDYQKDDYEIQYNFSWIPSVASIDSSIAQYAIWLQYEQARTDNAAARALRKDRWYERRVSWLVDLLDVMGVSAESVARKMRKGQNVGWWPQTEALARIPDFDYDFIVKAQASKPTRSANDGNEAQG